MQKGVHFASPAAGHHLPEPLVERFLFRAAFSGHGILQSLAFDVLAAAPQAPERRIAMLAELARAAGVAGMCGGQALDIDATGTAKGGQRHFSAETHRQPMYSNQESDADPLSLLERLHALKTGALLRCAVRLGAIAGGADPAQSRQLDRYADALVVD